MDDNYKNMCYINNRRYLGNKYSLSNYIRKVVDENCEDIVSFLDIFSGTGSVAYAFLDKVVYTNDILYSNYICNYAWFSSKPFDKEKIVRIIDNYNLLNCQEENYMTLNYSNTFFSFDDCSKIGYIREDIDNKYKNNEINERERAILITSLIYAMDKIANTVGHYDAYIRNQKEYKKLTLLIPNVSLTNNYKNECFNKDANELASEIKVDLVYIDPPYNSRQYCDAYHLLENVARWEKPEVFGVAKKMDRSGLKSKYCTKEAVNTFEDLINKLNTKYILLSYNDTGDRRNDRSNAKISDEDIISTLSKKGEVKVFSIDYKTFSTGKTKNLKNKERLFLCKCEVSNND